jgi:hypothetical protein
MANEAGLPWPPQVRARTILPKDLHWQGRSGDFRTLCHIVVGPITILLALVKTVAIAIVSA